MNDDKLMTTVKEPFAGVRMDTPVEQIVSRGRAVRARRRIPGVAGALAVLAAVALAVTALLPSGQHPAGTRLTAWTVTKLPDGKVEIFYWKLSDPGALQRELRAVGIPASVTVGHINPACRRYTGPVPVHGYQQSLTATPGSKTPSHIIIDPSTLPKGAGLEIAVQVPRPGGGVQGSEGLVQVSPACTGS